MNCATCGKKFGDLEDALEHAMKKHGVTKKEADAERRLHAKANTRG